MQTVQENKNFLTKEEVARASKARRYQLILGWPSTTNYLKMVENNMITNCNINTDDIKRADIIRGPAEYVLQGEMKRKKTKRTQQYFKADSPSVSVTTTQKITLYIDIFYVNRIPFFLSKIGKLNFLSGNKLKSKSGRYIKNAIE